MKSEWDVFRVPLVWVSLAMVLVLGLGGGVALGLFYQQVLGLYGHDVDRDFDEHHWRSDFEAIRGAVSDRDWQFHVDSVVGLCGEDAQDFRTYHAVGVDGIRILRWMRIDVSYVCPERLPVVDEMRASFRALIVACNTAPEQRTDLQQDVVANDEWCRFQVEMGRTDWQR